MRGRRKRSRQSSQNPTTQRVPVADMGINVQPKEECSSAPNNNDAITPIPFSDIKGITTPSPASSMSGAASFDPSTPINSQSLRTQLSRPTSTPHNWFQNDSNFRSNNAYPYFEKVHDHQTATDQNINTFAVHQQQSSKGQTATTFTGANANTRRSPSGLSGVNLRVPLVDNGDGIEDITIRQGCHQMKSSQHAFHSVKSPYTSTPTIKPSRQAPACRPMTFSGSSSGLAGLPPDRSWLNTSNPWANHLYTFGGSALNGSNDPGSPSPSYALDVNASCGNGLSDIYFGGGGGFSMDTRTEPFQSFASPTEHAFDANFQQQYETFLPSVFDHMSVVSSDQDTPNILQIDNSSTLENQKIRMGHHHGHSRS